jgi:hypothetical protein
MKSLRIKGTVAATLVAVAAGISVVMRDVEAVAASAGSTIDCYSAVDILEPFAPGATQVVVFDRVALSRGTPNADDLAPSYGRLSDRFKYSLKAGLLVRRHGTPLGPSPGTITPIQITVPLAWRDRAAIGWGNAATSWTVRVIGCRSTTPWVAFTGGYTVRSPMCVPLIVRMGNRSQRIRVAVGHPC